MTAFPNRPAHAVSARGGCVSALWGHTAVLYIHFNDSPAQRQGHGLNDLLRPDHPKVAELALGWRRGGQPLGDR